MSAAGCGSGGATCSTAVVERRTLWHPEDALSTAKTLTSPAELVNLLSSTLRERETGSLENSVRVLGLEACAELLIATIHTEGEGGLMTSDGKRRRTPGGVFFELMKQIASKAQYKEVFQDKTKAKNAVRNQRKKFTMKEE